MIINQKGRYKEQKLSTLYNHVIKLYQKKTSTLGLCRVLMDVEYKYGWHNTQKVSDHFRDQRPSESLHSKHFDKKQDHRSFWWAFEKYKEPKFDPRLRFLRHLARCVKKENI